jgi:hypothetical protein
VSEDHYAEPITAFSGAGHNNTERRGSMGGKVMKSKRSVVCLIGSGRHAEGYRRAYLQESVAGKIVLSIGFDVDGKCYPWEGEQKVRIEALQLDKIRMSDEVLVINTGGYVGKTTSEEILYAIALGKRLRWTESPPLDFFVEQDLVPK